MARLRAKAPSMDMITKPKVLVFGPPGVGKSWNACDFPHSYYIDTEGGVEPPGYQRKLAENGSVYFGKAEGSQHFLTVLEEIKALASEKHTFLTLVIDSFSKLYNLAAAEAELRVGNNFAADKKEANKPTRQLMSWLERLDMNVLLICHAKEKWVRKEGSNTKDLVSEGQTFDGWDKMEYDLHLAIEVKREGAIIRKSRLEGFPRDTRFNWSFAEFEKRAGADLMLRLPRQVITASPEQLVELRHLLSVVKMVDGWEEKVFSKAGVVSWEDMDTEKVKACIDKLKGQIKPEGKDGGSTTTE